MQSLLWVSLSTVQSHRVCARHDQQMREGGPAASDGFHAGPLGSGLELV